MDWVYSIYLTTTHAFQDILAGLHILIALFSILSSLLSLFSAPPSRYPLISVRPSLFHSWCPLLSALSSLLSPPCSLLAILSSLPFHLCSVSSVLFSLFSPLCPLISDLSCSILYDFSSLLSSLVSTPLLPPLCSRLCSLLPAFFYLPSPLCPLRSVVSSLSLCSLLFLLFVLSFVFASLLSPLCSLICAISAVSSLISSLFFVCWNSSGLSPRACSAGSHNSPVSSRHASIRTLFPRDAICMRYYTNLLVICMIKCILKLKVRQWNHMYIGRVHVHAQPRMRSNWYFSIINTCMIFMCFDM